MSENKPITLSSNQYSNTLLFLQEGEREAIFSALSQMNQLFQKDVLHPKISAYKSIVSNWNKTDDKDAGAQRRTVSYSSYKKAPRPFLAGVISQKALPRVYKILNVLTYTIESLGGAVTDDLSFVIRNQKISIQISESQDQIEHVLNRNEKAKIREYEQRKNKYNDTYKPNIRKYDYVFNGRVVIALDMYKIFRDRPNNLVENQLDKVILQLYEMSEVLRIEKEARDEQDRIKKEARQRHEDQINRYNQEIDKTNALSYLAQDYDTACKIRAYIMAVEKGPDFDNKSEWIAWAKNKADWYDPTIARTDEIIGKREHDKNNDEKTLAKRQNYRFSF